MSKPGKISSLLKDGSWIKKLDDEDEDVDRDPNFGKSILGQRSVTTVGPEGEEVKTTITTSRSTSVQALSKKFSSSPDEPSSGTYSTLKSDPPSSTVTTSKTTVTEEPKTSTTTTTMSRKSSTSDTTYSTLSSTGLRSPTETFTQRVQSSSKGAGTKLYDKDDYSPTDSKTTVYSTENVMVKGSPEIKTTTTTRTSSSAEDDLYGTLLPRSITDRTSSISSSISSSTSSSITKREVITVESSRGVESSILSSPSSIRTTSYSSYSEDLPSTRTTTTTRSISSTSNPSDDYSSDNYSSDNKSYSYSRPDSSYEYSSISSPTSYDSKSYRSNSRSDDADLIYSSSTKSVYGAPERSVLQKDLCTSCRKPFTGEAKMVLDDMKINCHASCFKCEVCNGTLAHMKAGDSMWIYKRMVHCENCFEVTRDKWRR
ncbi:sciellin isoform X2 [Clinocottus analis]|uniref:sciellin isoform X2 n=1 Tax=Clinocottus analis TaxID=304258 RepID=UPI0035C17DBA